MVSESKIVIIIEKKTSSAALTTFCVSLHGLTLGRNLPTIQVLWVFLSSPTYRPLSKIPLLCINIVSIFSWDLLWSQD